MLGVFTWLYLRVTPYDEATDISKGNLAPAIALAGAMLGFTFPLLVASYTHSNFLGFLAWGVISCLVQLLAFWILYWLLPRVIRRTSRGDLAGSSVCVGLINAASFIA